MAEVTQEQRQFLAEINEQAKQDHEKDKIMFEKHRSGKCVKEECCEEKWIVQAKKSYPNFRIENGLVIFDETSYQD